MSTFLGYMLVAHIILGLIGIGAFYAVWMGLLKKVPKLAFLFWASLLGFLSFIASWLTGGYYYVEYYGGAVKPIIKAGEYPWAHLVVMEAKEHIFLFLPILATLVFLSLALLKETALLNQGIRKALAYVVGFIVIAGIAITLGGMLISGAVR
ncbi:MAG: hypothetical protein AAB523_00455 [Patescibacteria group bacterium]